VHCPHCDSPSHVVETRGATDGAVRRRRECAGCGTRFTTYERYEPAGLFVRKRDGERQAFDRAKLRDALLRAAHKRPVQADEVERLVDRIEGTVRDEGGEVASRTVGELCLTGLRELDAGAYLQFAGVFDPAISAHPAASGPSGSVRLARKDAELPAQAGSRRGIDG
jgi:transcriptional repressor NrdR